MILFEIDSTAVETFSGVSKTTGRPYNFSVQSAYAYTVDSAGKERKFPEIVQINLKDGAKPYPVGKYTVCPSSLYVKEKRMMFTPRLVKVDK